MALLASVEESIAEISVELMVGREVFEQSVDYQERSKSASCWRRSITVFDGVHDKNTEAAVRWLHQQKKP